MKKELLASELRRLEDKTGRLTPQAVVDAARDPRSPLNPCFEWRDTVAAELYRIIQARALIRSIEVRVEAGIFRREYPKYIHDPDAEAGVACYRSVDKVAMDKDAARRAAVTECANAAAYLRRARELARVLEYPQKTFDATLVELGGLMRRAEEKRSGSARRH